MRMAMFVTLVLWTGCSTSQEFTFTLDRSAWEDEFSNTVVMQAEVEVDEKRTSFAWQPGVTSQSFRVLGQSSANVKVTVAAPGSIQVDETTGGGSLPLPMSDGDTLCIFGPEQLANCLSRTDRATARECQCDPSIALDGGMLDAASNDAGDAGMADPCSRHSRAIEVVEFDAEPTCERSSCIAAGAAAYVTADPKCGSAALGSGGGVYILEPVEDLKALTGVHFWIRPDSTVETRKQQIWFANYGNVPTTSTWLAELYVIVVEGRVGIELLLENGDSDFRRYCVRWEATALNTREWVEVEVFLTDRGDDANRPQWLLDPDSVGLAVRGKAATDRMCDDSAMAFSGRPPTIALGTIDDNATWYLGTNSDSANDQTLQGNTAIDHLQFLGTR